MTRENETEMIFKTHTDEDGTIRLVRWPEGLVLWVGGVIVWKQWEGKR